MRTNIVCLLFICFLSINGQSQTSDTINTKKGKFIIHFLGHGTLMFQINGNIIQVDPYSKVADYSTLPKADLVLITHEHGDHLDSTALSKTCTPKTTIYWTKICEKNSKFKAPAKVLVNGDRIIWKGILIEAVPAYNIINKRANGTTFHPLGDGNGYILTFAGKRIYIAGDTENIPEMLRYRPIDIAFLPLNLPYTMTPEMFKDAALMIDPKILYPYHTGKSDLSIIPDLLKNNPEIEVRIRKLE